MSSTIPSPPHADTLDAETVPSAPQMLALPRTAEALDAYDETVRIAMAAAIDDTSRLAEALEAERTAGRAVVVAFAAETADRNNQDDVLRYVSMAVPEDRRFIRRLVRQWRAS